MGKDEIDIGEGTSLWAEDAPQEAAQSDHPLYCTWQSMIRRYHYVPPDGSESRDYRNYGGRGISVCKEWRESFARFVADVGVKPSPQHSLDRIDNDGNYEPGNVRWATKREQSYNKRVVRKVAALIKSSCAAQALFRNVLQNKVRSAIYLSKAIGVSATTIAIWTSGTSRPEPHHRLWLQRHYKIPFDDWFTDAEYEHAYGHPRGEAPKQ